MTQDVCSVGDAPEGFERRKRLRVELDADLEVAAGVPRRLLITLPPGLHGVAELLRELAGRLPGTQPRRLRALIDGFALPEGQPLHDVVRDDDVLTVCEAAPFGASDAAAAAGAAAVAALAASSPPPEAAAKRRRRSSGAVGGLQVAPPEGMGEDEEAAECASPNSTLAALDAALRSGDRGGGHGGGSASGSPPPSAASQAPLLSSAEAALAARAVLTSHGRGSDAAATAGVAAAAAAAKDSLAARKAALLAEADALAAASAAASASSAAPAPGAGGGGELAGASAGGGATGSAGGGGQSEHTAFVGGLPWSVDEAILRRDFAECGQIVKLTLLTDKETGKSRGMAFVTFEEEAGLEAALKFDGDDYGGRMLKVAKAEGGGGGKGKGKAGKGKDGKGKGKGKGKDKAPGGGPKPAGCTSVYLKSLAYEATEDDLRQVFAGCGAGPTNVRILVDRETGESRGNAFVDFDDEGAVDEAVKLSGTVELKGRTFFVEFAKPRG